MEVNAGDFIIYRTEYMDRQRELDRQGMALSVVDNEVEISFGDSLDSCKIKDVKAVIPSNDASRKLAQEYNENLGG